MNAAQKSCLALHGTSILQRELCGSGIFGESSEYTQDRDSGRERYASYVRMRSSRLSVLQYQAAVI